MIKCYIVLQQNMKTKTTVSIEMEVFKWIESMVKKGRFANVSHGVEYCARLVKEQKLIS